MSHPALPWLRLLRTPGLGNAPLLQLLQQFGSAAAIVAAPQSRWSLPPRSKPGAIPAADDPTIVADLAWLASPDAGAVAIDDPAYPPLLRESVNPPVLLFTLGKAALMAEPQIAVVGARTATPQGLDNAQAFSAALSRQGLVISSGLAIGIDAAAHLGALSAQGPTLAVCGTGLDRVYPARHRELARRIVAEGGCLVSEFLPGTGVQAHHFPRRNRVLAAMALGCVVVEASLDSGSLLTAKLAAEAGREVFAIPGSIHNPLARGCHALIKQGAQLVETSDDVLAALAPQLRASLALRPVAPSAATTPEHDAAAALDTDAQRLWRALRDHPEPLDVLIARSGLSAAAAAASQLQLELLGLAGSGSGGLQRLPKPG